MSTRDVVALAAGDHVAPGPQSSRLPLIVLTAPLPTWKVGSMPTRARVSAVLLAAAAILAIGVVSAQAAWDHPEDLSAAGQKAFEQAVGTDANGNAVIAWN